MRTACAFALAVLAAVTLTAVGSPAAEGLPKLKLTVTETTVAKIHEGDLPAVVSGDARSGRRVVASPDNRHEAHPVARSFGKKPMVMAMDGQAYGPGLEGIDDDYPPVTWSPDSKRLAFVARSSRRSRCSVVLDGVEQKQYDTVRMPLVFSPDSRRFAYLAKKGERWLAVVDGVEGKEYDDVGGPIAFDAEGKRVAYSARAGDKWFVVADGEEGERYDFVRPPVLSPDGTRLAFAANSGSAWFVVLDGLRQPDYDGVSFASLTFSPNGQHFCYQARRGTSRVTVADGLEGIPYDASSYPEPPVYSPDSAHLAYCATRDNKAMVVLDGVEGKAFDDCRELTFSPDGCRLAYLAGNMEPGKSEWRMRVVLDGVEWPDCFGGSALSFSQDSKHLAYIAVVSLSFVKDTLAIVVDGVEAKRYASTFWGTRLVWDAPDRLHALMSSGSAARIVEVQIAEEEAPSLSRLPPQWASPAP